MSSEHDANAELTRRLAAAYAYRQKRKDNPMFSVQQKREIADAVQAILRATHHPELPQGEIQFALHVKGADAWSWADIHNNGSVLNPGVNPHNEMMDPRNKS